MVHRYAPVFSLLVLGSGSWAQAPFEHADQRTFQVNYGHCTALGSGWAVAGAVADDDGAPGYGLLRAFNASGEPAWEVIQQDGSNQVYTAALTTLQNGDVINACTLIECDVPVPWFRAERRDTNGTVIWSRNYTAYVYDMAANPGDSLAFLTDQGVLITNAEGDSLTTCATSGFYPYHAVWDTTGSLLISGSNGHLSRWALDGTLLAQTEFPGEILDLCAWKGYRSVLTQDGLLLTFDAQLNALDSLQVGTPSYQRQLLPLEDRLIIADNVTSSVLDSALAIIGSIPMDPDAEFPDDLFRSFAANESTLLQVAAATTAQRPAGLVRTVAITGDHMTHDDNVRIEVLNFDSVYYQLQSGIVFPKADVTVRVTNMATSVLNDVMVAHFLSFGPICGTAGTSVALENAGLDYGDFADVTMTNLYLNYAPWGWVNTDQVVCVGALSPNNLYDRDQSDNYACDTAHIVLGIQDPLQDDLGLLLPNPFAGALDLSFITPSKEPLRATLFDAIGRQLAATTIAAGIGRFHWELPALCNGVHLLRLEDRSTTTTRKLVHQLP